MVLANLRGIRESGTLFAIPTYAFIATLGLLVVLGSGSLAVRDAAAGRSGPSRTRSSHWACSSCSAPSPADAPR